MMCGSRSCSVSRSVSLGSNVNSLAMLVVIVMMTLYEAIRYDTIRQWEVIMNIDI